MASKKNPKVYFDIQVGRSHLGRVTMELYADSVPRTAENFRQLCTGEGGIGAKTRKPLHYKNCPFHRLIPGFMLQGGDFTNKDGSGGESIYGGKFADESLIPTGKCRHNAAGTLSMANCGPNSNGSQFFITFKSTPHLDGKVMEVDTLEPSTLGRWCPEVDQQAKHVGDGVEVDTLEPNTWAGCGWIQELVGGGFAQHEVFGKVIEGLDIVKQLEDIPTGASAKPLTDVIIADSGEVDENSKVSLQHPSDLPGKMGKMQCPCVLGRG
ncbi:hypothetical protein CYMTET_32909 [Cymbomonas tetramitiformis]|uniref:Peptidyl-prolyl cis-trans isomerase n=1 Tax=Cymbomonas tetramitiformis TaxID=36881 RepID=A0AAE0KRG9_9CHLO|nr:hypothetical protein CYMTET_32909 [Cymbomonas tetramitiformis]